MNEGRFIFCYVCPTYMTVRRQPETFPAARSRPITQLMFTPQDPDAGKSPPGESPYAGWLGLGFSLHAKDTHALNSSELSIGTVGPNAHAKEVQDFVHNLKGVDRFKGGTAEYKRNKRLFDGSSTDHPRLTKGTAPATTPKTDPIPRSLSNFHRRPRTACAATPRIRPTGTLTPALLNTYLSFCTLRCLGVGYYSPTFNGHFRVVEGTNTHCNVRYQRAVFLPFQRCDRMTGLGPSYPLSHGLYKNQLKVREGAKTGTPELPNVRHRPSYTEAVAAHSRHAICHQGKLPVAA